MDILIWNLLSESIFDFGKWSNWKLCKYAYLHDFQIDHFSKSKIDSESRFEMRMTIFVFYKNMSPDFTRKVCPKSVILFKYASMNFFIILSIYICLTPSAVEWCPNPQWGGVRPVSPLGCQGTDMWEQHSRSWPKKVHQIYISKEIGTQHPQTMGRFSQAHLCSASRFITLSRSNHSRESTRIAI